MRVELIVILVGVALVHPATSLQKERAQGPQDGRHRFFWPPKPMTPFEEFCSRISEWLGTVGASIAAGASSNATELTIQELVVSFVNSLCEETSSRSTQDWMYFHARSRQRGAGRHWGRGPRPVYITRGEQKLDDTFEPITILPEPRRSIYRKKDLDYSLDDGSYDKPDDANELDESRLAFRRQMTSVRGRKDLDYTDDDSDDKPDDANELDESQLDFRKQMSSRHWRKDHDYSDNNSNDRPDDANPLFPNTARSSMSRQSTIVVRPRLWFTKSKK